MGSLRFPCLSLALEVLLNLAPHYFPRSVAHSVRALLSSALPPAAFTSSPFSRCSRFLLLPAPLYSCMLFPPLGVALPGGLSNPVLSVKAS